VHNPHLGTFKLHINEHGEIQAHLVVVLVLYFLIINRLFIVMLRLFPFLLLKLGHFPIYGLVHALEFWENELVCM
jgi:hypothetical protein